VPLLARQLRMSWYMLFQLLPVISERALPRLIPYLWRSWSPGYTAEDDVQHVLAALPDAGHRTAALRYYRAFFLPWTREEGYAQERSWLLRAPRRPLLYLHGERDGCMGAEVARRGAELLPAGCSFELLADVGHFLQLEDPEGVGDRITAFLQAMEPGV
jgi:pimeloyl-ACP methyl ester carboxylesterase